MDENQNVSFEGTLVGTITHYFDKVSVAVVEPSDTIKNGDKIKIYDKQGNVIVEQVIDSMEIDKQKIEEAKPGQAFGMKVAGSVKAGDVVYKQ